MRSCMIIAAAAIGLAATPAFARTDCAALIARPTSAARAADAALVSKTGQHVTAMQVS
jgi:MinD superfamily P-loop ATPase